MIARVEYPDLDAGRYLAQLDVIGGEARRRLSTAVPPPDTPHDGDEHEDQQQFELRLLPRATKPQILARMLLNLKRVYVKMQSYPQARDVTDLLIAVDPSAINELRDRGLLAYTLKDFSGALRDLQA